ADNGIVAKSVDTGCTHEYACSCGGGYGNYIIIAHDDAVHSTVYAHLQAVFVSTGQRVSKGQLIGLVGTTGSSTGPHLHFEVRTNNVKVDPDSFSYQNE
ncbi:MAG: M23 family metallopeptidase, partial [Oscillospiraceae bacterium]|nr:M23 family metallopeptidase [Oscillospiraceae bacterium]